MSKCQSIGWRGGALAAYLLAIVTTALGIDLEVWGVFESCATPVLPADVAEYTSPQSDVCMPSNSL